jgi:hypothetical protein
MAAWTLAGSLLPSLASAQGLLFNFQQGQGTASQQYGLLNGELLALYLNARGDMGAPFVTSGGVTSKPGGILDANRRPFVNDNGSLTQQSNPGPTVGGTYGALFTRNSTAGAGSVGASVRAKNEYMTLLGASGNPGVTEGYSVVGNNDGLNDGFGGWLSSEALNLQNFSVNGASVSGPLSATSTLTAPLLGGSGGLLVRQNVSFQTDGIKRNFVKFEVDLTNTSTSERLEGVRYARAVDPNPGGSANPGSSQTRQRFTTPVRPDAFAVDSVFFGDEERHLGFGVLPGEPGTLGTTLVVTNELREGVLLGSPLDQLNGNRYVRLGQGNSAEFFLPDGSSTTVSDFTQAPELVDFFGTASADQALVLISPEYDIDPGQTQQFIFYYFFDPIQEPNGDVPEPGACAFLTALAVGGGLLLRRRRAR